MKNGGGEAGAAGDPLTSAVYDELRHIAARYLRFERPDHSLQPTALVHEVYLRLREQRKPLESRAHVCGVAAGLMRLVLVDHARRRKLARRATESYLMLEEAQDINGRDRVDFFLLNDALDRLAAVDPKLVQVVELRFFAGLSVEETAELMGASAAAVKREWKFAKAWLYRQLGDR
ncbi:MAG TPA: ECF-type sigma factor [Bryobacteraceae bacterium]|nr:ECF-type sigma factor [Bryobacteraceae bacterium]